MAPPDRFGRHDAADSRTWASRWRQLFDLGVTMAPPDHPGRHDGADGWTRGSRWRRCFDLGFTMQRQWFELGFRAAPTARLGRRNGAASGAWPSRRRCEFSFASTMAARGQLGLHGDGRDNLCLLGGTVEKPPPLALLQSSWLACMDSGSGRDATAYAGEGRCTGPAAKRRPIF